MGLGGGALGGQACLRELQWPCPRNSLATGREILLAVPSGFRVCPRALSCAERVFPPTPKMFGILPASNPWHGYERETFTPAIEAGCVFSPMIRPSRSVRYRTHSAAESGRRDGATPMNISR